MLKDAPFSVFVLRLNQAIQWKSTFQCGTTTLNEQMIKKKCHTKQIESNVFMSRKRYLWWLVVFKTRHSRHTRNSVYSLNAIIAGDRRAITKPLRTCVLRVCYLFHTFAHRCKRCVYVIVIAHIHNEPQYNWYHSQWKCVVAPAHSILNVKWTDSPKFPSRSQK